MNRLQGPAQGDSEEETPAKAQTVNRQISNESKPSVDGVSWKPDGVLTLPRWIECGRRLGALGRGVPWWIGDWLQFGNERYGEKYTRASRITGYDTQTLMNMVYVASRFGPERRRPSLSWSHHAELAALDASDQERWLDLATKERLSVRSLRQEVRSAQRAIGDGRATGSDRDASQRGSGGTGRVQCPHCQQDFEI